MPGRDARNEIVISLLALSAVLLAIGGAAALHHGYRKDRVKWDYVLSASRDLKAGALVGPGDLSTRAVPVQNVSKDALREPVAAIGQRLLVPVSADDEVRSTFFAAPSELCKDPKLFEETCAGTKKRPPCALTLAGYLAGSYRCRADYDEAQRLLQIYVDSDVLEWSFTLEFDTASDPPTMKRPYRARDVSHAYLSVDSTGAKAGPRFTAQHTAGSGAGDSLGSLTVILESVEKDLGWAHGSLEATALPECIVQQLCKADGQPSVTVKASF